MPDIASITTQEALDAALDAARQEVRAEFKDYDAIKSSQAAKDKKIAELTAKVKGYETDALKTKIGYELKLPVQLHSRLSGEDEASIRQDAEALSKMLGTAKGAPPLAGAESKEVNERTAAFRGLLASMEED